MRGNTHTRNTDTRTRKNSVNEGKISADTTTRRLSERANTRGETRREIRSQLSPCRTTSNTVSPRVSWAMIEKTASFAHSPRNFTDVTRKLSKHTSGSSGCTGRACATPHPNQKKMSERTCLEWKAGATRAILSTTLLPSPGSGPPDPAFCMVTAGKKRKPLCRNKQTCERMSCKRFTEI